MSVCCNSLFCSINFNTNSGVSLVFASIYGILSSVLFLLLQCFLCLQSPLLSLYDLPHSHSKYIVVLLTLLSTLLKTRFLCFWLKYVVSNVVNVSNYSHNFYNKIRHLFFLLFSLKLVAITIIFVNKK